MKTRTYLIIALLLLAINISTKALSPNVSKTAHTHLYEVNKEWGLHPTVAPSIEISFQTDVERIAYHLTLVEQHLRNNSPKGLSQSALAKRLSLLDVLKDYAKAGIFPQNIYHSERTPYFIDHRGVHCAVGHLIKASGNGDLAQEISQNENYAYLREIKTKGVAEWAKEWGFELGELAWIQPGYITDYYVPLLNGTNGPIQKMLSQYNGRIYFLGDFDTVDVAPCNQIGYYENDQLFCLGGGLLGTVADLSIANNVYVAGSIENAGNTYPLAIFSNNSWQFIDIPGRTAATASAINNGYYPNDIEIAISHPSIPGQQEIWVRNSSTQNWSLSATIMGFVNDIESGFYVGDFDSVTIHRNALPDSSFAAFNAIYYDYSNDNWRSIGNDLSDEVKVVKTIGNATYFGGMTSSIGTGIALSRYANGSLVPLIYQYNLIDSVVSIEDIDFEPTTGLLYIAGSFQVADFMSYGNNIATYDIVSNSLYAKGMFNSTIYSLEILQNGSGIFVGGSFTGAALSPPLRHFAKYAGQCYNGFGCTGIDNSEASNFQAKLYPNPAQERVNLDLGNYMEDISIQVVDLSGRLLLSREFKNEQLIQLELSELSSGLYLLQIVADGQRSTEKLRVSR